MHEQSYPVFFQQGFLEIGGTWFFNPNAKSIGSYLAQHCYDVWVGNNRGTIRSYKHVNMTDYDPEYWKFSFHEMAVYDLPANIDFVLNHTNQSKVIYIGHSQGTTQFFIQNTLHSNFAQKIKAFVGLGPIMYL